MDSPPLTAQEVLLVEKLAGDPLMIEERAALSGMLANKRKGVFEQEGR